MSGEMHPAFIEAQAVMDAKSKDYGATDPARSNYFPFGTYSYLQMIHTKVERMKSLVGRDAIHESMIDSVIDSINYHAMLLSYLRSLEVPENDDA